MTRILIAGGYGLVGSWVARHLRTAGHDMDIVLGGRNPAAGEGMANEVGASVARLDCDSASDDLTAIGAVDLVVSAIQDPDDKLISAALRTGAAHLGITRKVDNLGPTVMAAVDLARAPALFMGHWQAGVTSFATLDAACAFARVQSIAIGAMFDPADAIGPMTQQDRGAFFSKALIRRNGEWERIEQTENLRSIERGSLPMFQAQPMGVLDVPALVAMTAAKNVRFDIGMAQSIGTVSGASPSHEIYIDMEGEGADGAPLAQRTLVSNRQGQGHLTALGVLIGIERLLGLGGSEPLSAGIHFAERVVDPGKAVATLRRFGVSIERLDHPAGLKRD